MGAGFQGNQPEQKILTFSLTSSFMGRGEEQEGRRAGRTEGRALPTQKGSHQGSCTLTLLLSYVQTGLQDVQRGMGALAPQGPHGALPSLYPWSLILQRIQTAVGSSFS